MHISGTYGYTRARQLEGTYPGNPQEGTWQISPLRVMAGWGVASEEDWPGPLSYENWPLPEPPGVDAKAKANRIQCYQRVRTAEQCYRVLSRSLPVGVSIEITEQWFDAPGGVIDLPKTRDAVIGTHVVCIFGYSREKGGFEFLNSWGRDWGDQGFGILPEEYYDHHLIESWTNSSLLGLMPTRHHFGKKVLRWELPDLVYEGMKQFGVEIRDTSVDERIGWAFAVARDGYLDVEELFVKPQYRRHGYGRQLAHNLKELSWHVGQSLRLWVPFADYEPRNFPALARVAEMLGVEFAESGVRWAALKAVASDSASRLFIPPSIGGSDPGTVHIPHVSVPTRPAMPRPRASAIAAAAVAVSLAAGNPPSEETGIHTAPATAASTAQAPLVISEDDFQSLSCDELQQFAPLYERFAAREDGTKSDSSDAAAVTPDVLDWDNLIPAAPARPGGRIQVRLKRTRRDQPLPAEDPWAK